MAKTVYVLNGPNLNLLGAREPETYGHSSLKDVERLCRKVASSHQLGIEFRQSNHEGELVEWVHEAGAQKAAGVVLNAHPNLDRRTFERLKATLTNCVRHGPQNQNRDAHADFRGHLAGRVAWVGMLNPARGRKLDGSHDTAWA